MAVAYSPHCHNVAGVVIFNAKYSSIVGLNSHRVKFSEWKIFQDIQFAKTWARSWLSEVHIRPPGHRILFSYLCNILEVRWSCGHNYVSWRSGDTLWYSTNSMFNNCHWTHHPLSHGTCLGVLINFLSIVIETWQWSAIRTGNLMPDMPSQMNVFVCMYLARIYSNCQRENRPLEFLNWLNSHPLTQVSEKFMVHP